MARYELIDQTGEQFGRNRQWVVATLGAKKRAFCVIPAWEDYPAEQVKTDAEQVLRALNEAAELRAQVAALVAALKDAKQFIENGVELGYKTQTRPIPHITLYLTSKPPSKRQKGRRNEDQKENGLPAASSGE